MARGRNAGIAPYKSRYEFNQATRLEKNRVIFEYEKHKIIWEQAVTKGICVECGHDKVIKLRSYTPDFWFPKSQLFVETKGRFTSENRTFMNQIAQQSDKEIRMVFMADNYCTKKKGMRYSRWCELNDIEFAIGSIPLEWVVADTGQEEANVDD